MKNNNLKGIRFTARSLASMTLLCAILWLVPSGIAIHFVTREESAKLSHWLMSIHNTASLILLTAAIVHAIQNRKVLTNYVKTGVGKYMQYRREFLIVALSVSMIVLLVSTHVFHLS